MSVEIGVVSHAAAALAFGGLAALLAASWRGGLTGALLLAAAVLSSTWAVSGALQVSRGYGLWWPADMLEVLRSVAWIAFVLLVLGRSLIRSGTPATKLRATARPVFGFIGLMMAVTALRPVLEVVVDRPTLAMLLLGGRLVLAVVGMLAIEQLFRNAHPEHRWGIKFACLGLGGLFAFDFFLYADALLLTAINADLWAARGIVNALVVPLIAVSAARNPDWSLDVAVSRRFLFHSTSLFGAGLYLLIMAAAGWWIRWFGGVWGGVLQTTFLFGAGLLLVVVLFSGTVRARLRVTLSKHFFSYRYDYREEWLRFTRMLSDGEPGVLLRERSIAAIAGLVESPAGALWLPRGERVLECIAHWNMPDARGVERIDSDFMRFLEQQQWVVNLDEFDTRREMYASIDELPAWLRAIGSAWLVVPLMLHERLVGFVVLARPRTRVEVNWEVNDLLKVAGRQAAGYLAQLEAAEALVVARQFESFSRTSAFVVHDLKNLTAQLSLLLQNAARHKNNPAFQEDMITTVEHSVAKMNKLLLQLRPSTAGSGAPAGVIALAEVVESAIATKRALAPAPSFELDAGARGVGVVAERDRLERVVGHLVQNAIESTPPDGRVDVRLRRDGTSAIVEVVDTGRGMTAQFIRERLFKPFDSTKPKGMGIGAYESREYVREIGGEIDVESVEGRGSTFRLRLPLASADGTAGVARSVSA